MDDQSLQSINIFFNDDGDTDTEPDMVNIVGSSTSSSSKSATKNVVDVKELKKTVASLMSDNSNRLTFSTKVVKTPKVGKISEVWDKFQQAFIDEKPTDIYKCNSCPSLFYYKSETGNTAMKRHVCGGGKRMSESKGLGLQKIEKFFSSKAVPQESIRKLNRDITIGLASDLQPLYRVEGRGFLHICQSLINFGATHGRQSVEEVIQHRTTLKRNQVPRICAEIREDLKNKLTAAPSYPRFAFSKDMWSEQFNSTSFLSLTVHFIDTNWELRTATLGLEEVADTKTTENIRRECLDILRNYFDDDADLVMENSTSTTDGGSNMLKVFRRRMSCECHKINLFIKWMFNENKIPSDEKVAKRAAKKKPPFKPMKFFNFSKECPEMFNCIEAIKKLVTFFKQSKLNSTLTHTLKQEVPTRWNSELLMLEAYHKSANEVREILSKCEKIEKLINIKESVVQELIHFLVPFRDCSETLSGSDYPTIQLVALYYHDLKEHIEIKDCDSEELTKLKYQAKDCFEEYLVTSDIHYVACMLDPRYKSLKFVEAEQKVEAMLLLKTYMAESQMHINRTKKGSSSSSNTGDKGLAGASRKELSRSKASKFEDLMDVDDTQNSESVIDSELANYMMFKLPKIAEGEKFNILHFWRDANQFPILQGVANWLLAVPASEASDERTFSSAGVYVTPKSTNLSSNTISEMVFINKNANI